MGRATTPPEITGIIRAACGCIADVMDCRRTGDWPTVTAKVVIPCAGGHPELVKPGVIIHRDPKTVTMRGPVTAEEWTLATDGQPVEETGTAAVAEVVQLTLDLTGTRS